MTGNNFPVMFLRMISGDIKRGQFFYFNEHNGNILSLKNKYAHSIQLNIKKS